MEPAGRIYRALLDGRAPPDLPWPHEAIVKGDAKVHAIAAASILAKVERDGRFAVAVDGKVWSSWYEQLWEPVVSPNGERLLLRVLHDGAYVRQVVPFGPTFHE